MKQCKKLTRRQKEMVAKLNLNPKNWGIYKETPVRRGDKEQKLCGELFTPDQ